MIRPLVIAILLLPSAASAGSIVWLDTIPLDPGLSWLLDSHAAGADGFLNRAVIATFYSIAGSTGAIPDIPFTSAGGFDDGAFDSAPGASLV
jgi:hypothetical protein